MSDELKRKGSLEGYEKPTAEEAGVFARLLEAGVPAADALGIVKPELVEEAIPETARRWGKDRKVMEHLAYRTGWLTHPQEDRFRRAVTKNLLERAWFLLSHNYNNLETAKLAKAEKSLEVLQRELAGSSGQGDAMSQFYERFQKAAQQAAQKAAKGETVQ